MTRGVNLPQQLFRRAQAQYPTSLYVPSNVFNKTLTLVFDGGNGTITYTLNALGTGTYTWSVGGPGTVVGFNWQQDPCRGRFLPIVLSGVIPMNLHLAYTSATAGTFKGMALPSYPSSVGVIAVSDTFTSSP